MKFVVKQRTSIHISEVLLLIFALTQFGTKIIRINPLFGNMLIALSGLSCYAYCFYPKHLNRDAESKNITNKSFILIIDSLMAVHAIIGILYNHNQNILDILWIFSYSGVALLLYKERIRDYTYRLIHYLLLLYFIIAIFKGVSLSNVLASGSENNVSVFLLLALYMLLLPYQYNNRTIPIIPFILSVIVIIWTGSRAGIVSASGLTVCVVLYNLHIRGQLTKKLLAISLLFIGVYFIMAKHASVLLSRTVYKLDNYGLTGGTRLLIWQEYIKSTIDNPINVLLGTRAINAGFWCSVYGGNLHNSILTAHANYGLSIFIGFILSIIIVLYKCIVTKNYVLAMIIVSAVLRSLFDWTAFPGCFDVLFFYVLIWLSGLSRKHYL